MCEVELCEGRGIRRKEGRVGRERIGLSVMEKKIG